MFNQNPQQIQHTLSMLPQQGLDQLAQTGSAIAPMSAVLDEEQNRARMRMGNPAAQNNPAPNPMGAQPIGQPPQAQGLAGLPTPNMTPMKAGGVVPGEFPTDAKGWHAALTGELDRRKKMAQGGVASFDKGGRAKVLLPFFREFADEPVQIPGTSSDTALNRMLAGTYAPAPSQDVEVGINTNFEPQQNSGPSLRQRMIDSFTGKSSTPISAPADLSKLDAQASSPVGLPTPAKIVMPPNAANTSGGAAVKKQTPAASPPQVAAAKAVADKSDGIISFEDALKQVRTAMDTGAETGEMQKLLATRRTENEARSPGLMGLLGFGLHAMQGKAGSSVWDRLGAGAAGAMGGYQTEAEGQRKTAQGIDSEDLKRLAQDIAEKKATNLDPSIENTT